MTWTIHTSSGWKWARSGLVLCLVSVLISLMWLSLLSMHHLTQKPWTWFIFKPLRNMSSSPPPLLLSLLNKVRRQRGEKTFVTRLSRWRSCTLSAVGVYWCVCVCVSGSANMENLLWLGAKYELILCVWECVLYYVCVCMVQHVYDQMWGSF